MGKFNDLTPEELEKLSAQELESRMEHKQKLFAFNYCIHYNASKAAIEAGYSEKTAGEKGRQLKNHPLVAAYIEMINQRRLKRLEITSDRVLKEFAKIGFFDIKDIYDEKGNIIPVEQMKPSVSAGISKIKEKLIQITDDNEKVIEREYHFHNKVSALENLGKHLGIYEKDNKQQMASVNLYLPDNKRKTAKEKKDEQKQSS